MQTGFLTLLADATDGSKGPPTGLDPIMMLLMFGLPLILFLVLPARREARVRREILSNLKKGDRVLINGFLIGSITQITKAEKPGIEDELLVKVDDNANLKLRVLRSSVSRILQPADSNAKDGA